MSTTYDVVKLSEATNVNGTKISIGVTDEFFRINDAYFIIADISASNGVIHVNDMVMLPN